jgi:hypothetical protein
MVGEGFGNDRSIIQMLPYLPTGKNSEKIKVVCTNCGTSFKKKGDGFLLGPCHKCGKNTLEMAKK